MELDQLRAWVRRELSPRERREVTRWMLRTTDPHLPVVLTALTREWEEELADQRLLARRADRSWLVEAWKWVREQGAAALSIDAGATPGLQLLDTTEEAPEPLVVREVGPDRVDVSVYLKNSANFVLFAAPDGGEVICMRGPRPGDGGQPSIGFQADPGDGRTTFWLFVGDALPPQSLAEAIAAARRGVLVVHAVRWWPTPA